MTSASIRIGILGASGYTGAELVRLLGDHPRAEIRVLTAERQAGKPIGEVFPQLAVFDLPTLVKVDEIDTSTLDVVFCCLPHATTQAIIKGLPRGPRIIDLSADFRLRDPALYESTYGHAHQALELQEQAVYGLSEHYRDAIRSAWLVANPGCYTTTAELPLVPLLQERLVQLDGIIIDAKSGVSGAGRDAKQGSLFTEVAEGIHAYGVASHRHTPEIEQCLADFAGQPVRVTFTPHLMPMSRGILGTIYVRLTGGASPQDLHACLARAYAGEPFVHVLPFKTLPATRHVRGTNLCLIGVHPSRVPGEAILFAVLDNLVKGASGQAIQNMNVMLGLDERLGLSQRPLFP
jgi:N-acetyl-gamma-glutamyl-phosphate reductase